MAKYLARNWHAVQATWGSFRGSWAVTRDCKPSMAIALSVTIDSPGDTRATQKVTQACRYCSSFIILKVFVLQSGKTKADAMVQSVIILVFTALASSFVWWRSRFKICRMCRSRIRRWASVCHLLRSRVSCGSTGVFPIPPFVHGEVVWPGRSGVFESARERSED
jgi:hypothetical protein